MATSNKRLSESVQAAKCLLHVAAANFDFSTKTDGLTSIISKIEGRVYIQAAELVARKDRIAGKPAWDCILELAEGVKTFLYTEGAKLMVEKIKELKSQEATNG